VRAAEILPLKSARPRPSARSPAAAVIRTRFGLSDGPVTTATASIPLALGRSAVGAIRRQPRRVRSRSSQRVADASTWVSSLTKWVVTTYGSDRKLGYVSLISRTSFSVSFGFRAILLIYTKMQIHYVSLEEIYLSLDISFTYFKI